MASNTEDEHSLKEVEAYVKKHDIQQVLKECIVQLCISRPDNHYTFLKDYFERLEKGQVRRQLSSFAPEIQAVYSDESLVLYNLWRLKLQHLFAIISSADYRKSRSNIRYCDEYEALTTAVESNGQVVFRVIKAQFRDAVNRH